VGLALKVLGQIAPNISRSEFETLLTHAFDECYETFQSTIKKFNKDFLDGCSSCKVLCLSEDPLNSVMWGMYADSHKGVVMAFQNIPGIDSPYKCAEPMRYSKIMPSLYDEDSLSDLMSGRTALSSPAHTRKVMEKFALTKDEKWSHEREWRVVLWSDDFSNAIYEDGHFHELELRKIIFGYSMPDEQRQEIREIAIDKYPHVVFGEANYKENSMEYTMEIQKVL
jgi:hypothetical protein